MKTIVGSIGDIPRWSRVSSHNGYCGKPLDWVLLGTIGAGAYDAFHLKIKRMVGTLKKDQRSKSIINLIGAVKLPFEVRHGGKTLLIVDLTVSGFSDHPPRGYELVVKGYQLFTNGKLVEKIPPG